MFCIIHVFTFKCGFTYISDDLNFYAGKKFSKNRVKILFLIDKFGWITSNWNSLDFGSFDKRQSEPVWSWTVIILVNIITVVGNSVVAAFLAAFLAITFQILWKD